MEIEEESDNIKRPSTRRDVNPRPLVIHARTTARCAMAKVSAPMDVARIESGFF